MLAMTEGLESKIVSILKSILDSFNKGIVGVISRI